jgi:hypothetical protein
MELGRTIRAARPVVDRLTLPNMGGSLCMPNQECRSRSIARENRVPQKARKRQYKLQ